MNPDWLLGTPAYSIKNFNGYEKILFVESWLEFMKLALSLTMCFILCLIASAEF